jgi:SPP1 gp7 family putative phage head morphogenesis protein
LGIWSSVKAAMGLGKTKELEEAAARDPKKTAVKKLGTAVFSGAAGTFEVNTIDFTQILAAYHTDSYIRRAIDKHVALMFKNGWGFSGSNDQSTTYVKTRFKLMEEGTSTSWDELLDQLAFDFVLYSNAYLVKARAKGGQAAQGVQATGYTSNQPVAGYFILPAQNMRIMRDVNGNIMQYEQMPQGGGASITTYKPEDVIHFQYRVPTGRAYGIPLIWNVMDDVKLLRQLEENVARLVYRNLFPLYQYQVGLDKPGFEATDEEIDDIREQIRNMPMDGGIVVPERHNISVVSSGSAALNAAPYLQYYRERVFSGLGVSSTVMGIGGDASRSTSDNQAADLFDSVKEFQRSFSMQFQQKVVNEILFEGGYDPTLNPQDQVLFEFEEIELDAKIKKENHLMQIFMQNGITYEEMRQDMGRDIQVDESRLFSNMFIATATAASNGAVSDTTTTGGGSSAGTGKGTAASKATGGAASQGNNQNKPANQHGKQLSPSKPKASVSEKVDEKVLTEAKEVVTLTTELPIKSYEQAMKKFWDALSDDVVSRVKRGDTLTEIKAYAIELTRQSLNSKTRQYVTSAMMKGLVSGREELKKAGHKGTSVHFAVSQIEKQAGKYVNSLIDDVIHLVTAAQKKEAVEDQLASVRGAFNSITYRLSFIAQTELNRAYNYGLAIAAKEAGLKEVHTAGHEHACEECAKKNGEAIVLTDHNLIDVIPPHHPNCDCLVQLNISAEEV